MEDELDLVVFEDDEGNELTMEVLDYFFYEGQEYALLAEVQEKCDACKDESCDACEYQRDAVVMKVVPVGDDEEEFIPVDDELSEKLLEIVENGLYDEDEALDDAEEEDDEEDEDGEDEDEKE